MASRHRAFSRRAFMGGSGASALSLAVLLRGTALSGAATAGAPTTIELPTGAGTLGQGESNCSRRKISTSRR